MDVLVSIGQFSKMTYLSVKALRYYHDVGLLEPALVDPVTSYRHYAVDQVGTAQAIRRFRDLEMPIEEVRRVLRAPDDAARNRAILVHLERMHRQLDQTRAAVESLESLLGAGAVGSQVAALLLRLAEPAGRPQSFPAGAQCAARNERLQQAFGAGRSRQVREAGGFVFEFGG